jgi:hypothetical protein
MLAATLGQAVGPGLSGLADSIGLSHVMWSIHCALLSLSLLRYQPSVPNRRAKGPIPERTISPIYRAAMPDPAVTTLHQTLCARRVSGDVRAAYRSRNLHAEPGFVGLIPFPQDIGSCRPMASGPGTSVALALCCRCKYMKPARGIGYAGVRPVGVDDGQRHPAVTRMRSAHRGHYARDQ